jgi:hypothetical protein
VGLDGAIESSTADGAETGAPPVCSVPLQTLDCCLDGICSRCPATADELAAVFCPLDPVGTTTRAPDSGRGAFVWWANLTTIPCDGLLIAAVGDGIDCTEYFFFDATTRALVAAGQWGSCGSQCGATTAGFQWPSACTPSPLEGQGRDLPDASAPVPLCPDGG